MMIISTVLTAILAFTAMCGEVWTLDDSAKMPGKFWTITSPDKKWTLACVPSWYDDLHTDSSESADLVICSKYWYDEGDYDWEECSTEDVYRKDVDCVLGGSGVLKLPVKARNSEGEEFTVELAAWSMEGWYKNGGSKITK